MLRPYQQRAISEIEDLWSWGVKKILLSSPTGSGKTVIMAEIIRRHEGPVLFAVRGRELVKNASMRISEPHGVLMAGHPQYDLSRRIQVASIDTILAREEYPPASLVLIDEAHLAAGPGFQQFAAMYPEANMLSVTATPYIHNSLRHIADTIVETTSIGDLINDKYLVPPVYFAPKIPDLSKIRICGDEYNQEDVEREVTSSHIVGSVVRTARESLPCCGLIFCSSVNHSQILRRDLELAGVSCAHIDASTPDQERHRILQQHKEGHVQFITNVGVLTTGVDIPHLTVIIDAAPTLSLCRYIQKLGRGTRPFPGKEHFTVYDHAGNVHTHGFITDRFEPTIDGARYRQPGKAAIVTCRRCFAVLPVGVGSCPFCKETIQNPVGKTLKEVDGRLVPMTEYDRLPRMEAAKLFKRKLVFTAMKRGLKRGWVFWNIKKKFGEDIANKLLPWNGSSTLSKSDLD